MITTILAVAIGYVLDLCIGDPHWLPHPIRLIGWLISKIEKEIRKIFPKTEKGEIIGGAVVVLLVLLISTLVPFFLLYGAGLLHPVARIVLESLFCYQLFATKALREESMKVQDALKSKDLEASRQAVSMIVGRDTKNLDEEGVAKAAIETVAENTSDGIIAPLLFMVAGGAPLGFFYKAANTMDSMLGYKNETYLYFGRVAARLDDILNYLPARISAFLMIIASYFLGLDWKGAIRIFRRDRFNHASPNSAQTESVCAGALQVQLAGDAYYFGVLHEKKTIGDPIRAVVPEDISTANLLLYLSSFLGLFFSSVFYIVIFLFI